MDMIRTLKVDSSTLRAPKAVAAAPTSKPAFASMTGNATWNGYVSTHSWAPTRRPLNGST